MSFAAKIALREAELEYNARVCYIERAEAMASAVMSAFTPTFLGFATTPIRLMSYVRGTMCGHQYDDVKAKLVLTPETTKDNIVDFILNNQHSDGLFIRFRSDKYTYWNNQWVRECVVSSAVSSEPFESDRPVEKIWRDMYANPDAITECRERQEGEAAAALELYNRVVYDIIVTHRCH